MVWREETRPDASTVPVGFVGFNVTSGLYEASNGAEWVPAVWVPVLPDAKRDADLRATDVAEADRF